MKTQRNYTGKGVDMLTTCAAIIENGITNQEFLVSKRKNWAAPFLTDLKTRIDNAFSKYLGIDSASDQQKATQTVTQIQTVALEDLAELKSKSKKTLSPTKPQR